jgi:hypothetical protein
LQKERTELQNCVVLKIYKRYFINFLDLLLKNVKRREHRILIFPVTLNGRETSSLILRKEQRLRTFKHTVKRSTLCPRNQEVTAGWTKLHNDEIQNLYFSPNIIRLTKSRRMRWAGRVAYTWGGGVGGTTGNVLMGKPEWKTPLGRHVHKCEDNTEIYLEEIR